MTNPGAGRFSEAHWRKLYEAAVLELDTAKLPDRIEEAKKEIETRLAELTSSAQNSEWEPLIGGRAGAIHRRCRESASLTR
jgi:hypothetical protein